MAAEPAASAPGVGWLLAFQGHPLLQPLGPDGSRGMFLSPPSPLPWCKSADSAMGTLLLGRLEDGKGAEAGSQARERQLPGLLPRSSARLTWPVSRVGVHRLPQLRPADGPPFPGGLRTPVTLPLTAHTGSLICHPARLGATSNSFLCLQHPGWGLAPCRCSINVCGLNDL